VRDLLCQNLALISDMEPGSSYRLRCILTIRVFLDCLEKKMCVVLCVERRMAYGVVVSIVWEFSLSFLASFLSTLASKLLDDAYILVESILLTHPIASCCALPIVIEHSTSERSQVQVLKIRTFTYNKNHTFILLTHVVFLFWPENTYFFA